METLKYTDTVLLVFAKAPVPGEVNTRLIPDLGVQPATELQAELVHSRLRSFSTSQLCEMQLWCSPDSGHDFFEGCKEQYGVPLYEQQGENLGARMSYAIETALQNFKRVILIGTDAPALDHMQIEEAINSLGGDSDIVVVPAEDGGYVLIGMNYHYEKVFLAVPWGTERVLRKTRANAIALGIKLNELEMCWDIDRVEDYERYQAMKN
jgi:rSAM/selenodomain-associated transferase 1